MERRLDDSFIDEAAKLRYFGNPLRYKQMLLLANIINRVEIETGGHWQTDDQTFQAVQEAVNTVLCSLGPNSARKPSIFTEYGGQFLGKRVAEERLMELFQNNDQQKGGGDK